MIPLVSPTITDTDRQHLAARAYDGGAFDERTVRQFEEAFAERVGCAGAVAVCSGTEALRLALRATYVGHPSRSPSIHAQTYICTAAANASALRLPLLDSEFEVRTATMSVSLGDRRPDVNNVLLTHMFGRPSLFAGTAVVEDWTLSLAYEVPMASRVGVCSTHASKMISTGRGGVVFSNDTALLDEVRQLAYYDSTPNGTLGAHSLGMSSMQAALGLSQLRQLGNFIDRRREIARYYSERFIEAGIECPMGTETFATCVFFRYLISVDCPGCKMGALYEHGIEAGRGVYPPLHRQLGLPDDQFPGATWCVEHLLSVPCHPSMSDADVEFVAEKVLEVCA